MPGRLPWCKTKTDRSLLLLAKIGKVGNGDGGDGEGHAWNGDVSCLCTSCSFGCSCSCNRCGCGCLGSGAGQQMTPLAKVWEIRNGDGGDGKGHAWNGDILSLRTLVFFGGWCGLCRLAAHGAGHGGICSCGRRKGQERTHVNHEVEVFASCGRLHQQLLSPDHGQTMHFKHIPDATVAASARRARQHTACVLCIRQ